MSFRENIAFLSRKTKLDALIGCSGRKQTTSQNIDGSAAAAGRDPRPYLKLIALLRREIHQHRRNHQHASASSSSSSSSLESQLYSTYAQIATHFPLLYAFNPLLLAQWEADYVDWLRTLKNGRNTDSTSAITVSLFEPLDVASTVSSSSSPPFRDPIPPLMVVSPLTLLGLHAYAKSGEVTANTTTVDCNEGKNKASSTASPTAFMAKVLYNNALALWCQAVGMDEGAAISMRTANMAMPKKRTGEGSGDDGDDGLEDENFVSYVTIRSESLTISEAPPPYRITFDISIPAAVREAFARLCAITSVLGGGGVPNHRLLNNDDPSTAPPSPPSLPSYCTSLWWDLHRTMLEVCGAACIDMRNVSGSNNKSAPQEKNDEEDGGGQADTTIDDEEKEEASAEKMCEQLAKRSFQQSLRNPTYSDAILAAVSEHYVAYGCDARAAKTSSSLVQGGAQRKAVAKALGVLEEAQRQLLKAIITIALSPSTSSASFSSSPHLHQHYSKCLIAYAWECAKSVDGLAGHCALLHGLLVVVFAEMEAAEETSNAMQGGGFNGKKKGGAVAFLSESTAALVKVLWPSSLKYLVKGLAFGQSNNHSHNSNTSNTIAAALSLAEIGPRACMDPHFVMAPLFLSMADLLRVGGSTSVRPTAPIAPVSASTTNNNQTDTPTPAIQQVIGEKRPREEEEEEKGEGDGGEAEMREENEKAALEEGEEEEEEADPPTPILSEADIVSKLSELAASSLQVAVEATLHHHERSAAMAAKALAIVDGIALKQLAARLLVGNGGGNEEEGGGGEGNVNSSGGDDSEEDEDADDAYHNNAAVLLCGVKLAIASRPIPFTADTRLQRAIARLRLFVAVKRVFAGPFSLYGRHQEEESSIDGRSSSSASSLPSFNSVSKLPIASLATYVLRVFRTVIEESTNAIAIEGYDDFSPFEIADAAHATLSNLPTVASFVLPTLLNASAHEEDGSGNSSSLQRLQLPIVDDLHASITKVTSQWEGILRRLVNIEREAADTTTTGDDDDNVDNAEKKKQKKQQHDALLRRAIAKVRDVLSALIDFKMNQLLLPQGGGSSSALFAIPSELAYSYQCVSKTQL